MMKTLTIKEAVDRVNSGEDLKGIVLDKESMSQVNVRDAMVLNRGGIVIPEENLFYDDNDIEYDEEIDELVIGREITGMTWEEKSKKFERSVLSQEPVSINIMTKEPEIDNWIEKNKIKLADVLRPIIINLFNAEQSLKTSSSDSVIPPTN